jgi:dipeptidyl aminopeptidase/acylaminoacyl peptidase
MSRELFGGTPEQKKDLYEDRSPITHISNIKAPVMIIASKNDSTCPIEPIEKFINKLKEKNHPHEFIIQEKAGHLSALFNWEESVPLLTKIVEFLKRNLT